ncbi:MAG TPA: SMP-30/gluconolactonase/LRE family protein [Micropepsaceae bacterium]|nr:SMP-30/gluconolactonase/LRE family protein [Micropepsaceae bacterium]
MIRETLITLSLTLAAAVGLSPAKAQTPPNTVALQPSPAIAGVIKGGTMPEVVIKGLTSSDDSFWLPNVGLIFSESQANRIVRLDEHDQPVTFIGGLLNPLGMVFTAQGELISIQTKPGFMGPRVVWPKGHERIIADNYQGQPFGRPNDIVANSKGGVYFTDPPAHAVYYVPPGGTIIRVSYGELNTPNGLQLSHDEKTLYVNDTQGIHMHAFDVLPDGRLTNDRVFANYVGRDVSRAATEPPISRADGMVTDNDGRIYALTDSGIEVFTPTGAHLGAIPVWCITRRCQNLGFGGPDKRTLYVSGGGTLLRIPMLAQGYLGRAK